MNQKAETNAVIYARYSSHGQTEQSIEGQLHDCREFAAHEGYTVVGEYIDRAMTGLYIFLTICVAVLSANFALRGISARGKQVRAASKANPPLSQIRAI